MHSPHSRPGSASTSSTGTRPPSDVHPRGDDDQDTPEHGDTSRTHNPLQLPPIRTLLGDELALPTPSSHSPRSAYSTGSHRSFHDQEREETSSKSGSSTGSDRDGSSGSSSRAERHLSPGEMHRHRSYDSSLHPLPRASPSRSASAHPSQSFRPTFQAPSFSPVPHTHSLPPAPFPLHPSAHYNPTLPPPWPPSPFPPPPHPYGPGTSFHPSPSRYSFPSSLTLPLPTAYSDLSPLPTDPSSPFPDPPATPQTAPALLHVLRPSASGQLITGPSISRTRTRPGTSGSGTAAGERTRQGGNEARNARKHVCPLCNKTFNRPSSLKTHQSVHTGSRPFSCPYKGCTKTFSVASNMRRHLRNHDPCHPEQPSPGPSHSHTRAQSHSRSQRPDSHSPASSSPERAQESMGSSEGEGDMDVETEEVRQSTSGSAGGVMSPALSAPAPRTHFEWTAGAQDAHVGEENHMSETHQAGEARDVSARPRIRRSERSRGRRTGDRRPR